MFYNQNYVAFSEMRKIAKTMDQKTLDEVEDMARFYERTDPFNSIPLLSLFAICAGFWILYGIYNLTNYVLN